MDTDESAMPIHPPAPQTADSQRAGLGYAVGGGEQGAEAVVDCLKDVAQSVQPGARACDDRLQFARVTEKRFNACSAAVLALPSDGVSAQIKVAGGMVLDGLVCGHCGQPVFARGPVLGIRLEISDHAEPPFCFRFSAATTTGADSASATGALKA